MTATLGDRVLSGRSVRLGPGGNAVATLVIPTAGLSGDVPLRVGLSGHSDAESRDDARLYLLRVSPTPGIVLLASPPDWDSRFLFQALRDVADFRQGAEQRKSAVADVITARPVVEKPNHLVAEFAVLQDSVGDEAAKVSCAGDQDTLESDSGAPAAFQRLAYDLA